jgi:hypothetical protein
LQGRIIVNICFGSGAHGIKVPYENEDGTISQESIGSQVSKVMADMVMRMAHPK